MDDKKVAIILFIFFILGFLAGAWIMSAQDFKYKDASIKTCEYANELAVIVNSQSEIIETCKKMPTNELIRMDQLNCTKLKGG